MFLSWSVTACSARLVGYISALCCFRHRGSTPWSVNLATIGFVLGLGRFPFVSAFLGLCPLWECRRASWSALVRLLSRVSARHFDWPGCRDVWAHDSYVEHTTWICSSLKTLTQETLHTKITIKEGLQRTLRDSNTSSSFLTGCSVWLRGSIVECPCCSNQFRACVFMFLSWGVNACSARLVGHISAHCCFRHWLSLVSELGHHRLCSWTLPFSFLVFLWLLCPLWPSSCALVRLLSAVSVRFFVGRLPLGPILTGQDVAIFGRLVRQEHNLELLQPNERHSSQKPFTE